MIATKDGYMNRYDASEVSIIEPASFGVKSIELKSRPNDYVVGAKYVSEKILFYYLLIGEILNAFVPKKLTKVRKIM